MAPALLAAVLPLNSVKDGRSSFWELSAELLAPSCKRVLIVITYESTAATIML